MARLVGVDLPRDKRIEVALTYIFGVGRTRALKTLEATGISGDKRVHELGDEELVKLRDWIEGRGPAVLAASMTSPERRAGTRHARHLRRN
jgi:ribosomal protein S13